jgi:hypothetical protein
MSGARYEIVIDGTLLSRPWAVARATEIDMHHVSLRPTPQRLQKPVAGHLL